jgi:hypothetical protein
MKNSKNKARFVTIALHDMAGSILPVYLIRYLFPRALRSRRDAKQGTFLLVLPL